MALSKGMRNVFRCGGSLESGGWMVCKAASALSRTNAHDEISRLHRTASVIRLASR